MVPPHRSGSLAWSPLHLVQAGARDAVGAAYWTHLFPGTGASSCTRAGSCADGRGGCTAAGDGRPEAAR